MKAVLTLSKSCPLSCLTIYGRVSELPRLGFTHTYPATYRWIEPGNHRNERLHMVLLPNLRPKEPHPYQYETSGQLNQTDVPDHRVRPVSSLSRPPSL